MVNLFLKDGLLNAGVPDRTPVVSERCHLQGRRTEQAGFFTSPISKKNHLLPGSYLMKPLISLRRSFSAKTTFVFYQSNAIMICNKVLKKPQQRQVQTHLHVLEISSLRPRTSQQDPTRLPLLHHQLKHIRFSTSRWLKATLTQVLGKPWACYSPSSCGLTRKSKVEKNHWCIE